MDADGHVLPYRRDIDGLRAIAVLAVVFYHIGLTECPGGFVGVDVFFVISGYLITSSILADQRSGRFSLLAFYDRRMRRIFPALFAMAVIVTLVVAFLLPPSAFADYAKSLAAMGGFVSNIYFWIIGSDGGYFAKLSAEPFLLHTWSLSVEEQFYLFMPVLLMLLAGRPESFRLKILSGAALLSFLYSVVAVEIAPIEAFYDMLSRAWELLLGALLAAGIWRGDASRKTRAILSTAGLVSIIGAVAFFETAMPFPGVAALLPCGGAALLIATGAGQDTHVARWLSTRPMVWIGRISYSLYLWHWPIVAAARYLTVGHLNLPLRIAIVLSSLGAAQLSLVFVERPFRRRPFVLPARKVVTSGLLASIVVIASGTAIANGAGLPQRFDPAARALLAANERREDEHPPPPCENLRKDVHTMGDIAFCPIGDEPRHIMFWGDSHAHLLEPLVRELHGDGRLGGRSAIFAIAAACPIALDLDRSALGFHCAAFTRLALQRALASDVDVVVFGFAAWFELNDSSVCKIENGLCGAPLRHQEVEDIVLRSLREIVTTLQRHGKRVVIALPAPFYSDPIPQLLEEKIALGRMDRVLRVEDRLQRIDFTGLRDRLLALAHELHVRTFDPREALCPGDRCFYQRDGVSIYTDTNHVAGSQVEMFAPSLLAALDGEAPSAHGTFSSRAP